MNAFSHIPATQLVFNDMVESGDLFDFYGVDSTCFKLGDMVLEAVEDKDDGYRSYFGSFEVPSEGHIFFKKPVAKVRIYFMERPEDRKEARKYVGGDFRGWELRDEDGHVWLRCGTDYTDDWYPYFVFHYRPRPGTPE